MPEATDIVPPGRHDGRVMDIIIAMTALALLWPVMLLISVAILIESGRPILFAQKRFGRGGRPFDILKFRKFRTKDTISGLPLTLQNDERMSHIGTFLARTKLDELPQFFNVLRGDMAIVGPRPESLAFADCFTPANRQLLDYRPGLFGPSQCAFRNESGSFPLDADPTVFYRQVLFPMKAGVDLAYYPHRTMASDLKWLALSLLAVFGVPVRDLQTMKVAPERAVSSDRQRPATIVRQA